MTRLDHLRRVLATHAPNGPACVCGHDGDYTDHLAWIVETVVWTLETAALWEASTAQRRAVERR